MLSPTLVGDIAHGRLDVSGWTREDVRALLRHNLAYAAQSVLATGADETGALAPLRDVARAQALRSIAVVATAGRCVEVLRDAGVRGLTYKGPALAIQTTGTWLGRGSADVDLLVHEDDIAAAHDALRAAGCSSRAGHTGPPTRAERYRIGERTYDGLAVAVDLHWRVETNPGYYSARFDDLWERRDEVDLDGVPASTLGQVDALLVTMVHGTKERWWRWFWALDAVRQAEALPAEGWVEARNRARACGAATALALGLAVVDACGGRPTGAPAPAPAVRDEATRWLADSADSGSVEWTHGAALRRRRARWWVADSRRSAVDGVLRSVARLIADRRLPTTPQVQPDAAAPPRH